MITEITFAPLVPWTLLAVLTGVVLALISLSIWRGLPGWAPRLLAACVVLMALANPALKQEERDPLTDIVLVVIDESASQGVADRPAQLAEAIKALTAELDGVDTLEVRTVTVRDAPADTDAGTLLMTGLAELAGSEAKSRIAGAILVTDGQVHDMEMAPEFTMPVHVLLTGSNRDWDRRLVITNAPAFAILGEPVTLGLKVEDQGAVPDDLPPFAELSVSIDGGPTQTFRVTVGEDMQVPLKLNHGGQNVLQFEIEASPGELTDRNNAAVVAINGVRDRLRVLLVSGEPHAGERTWRNLLKSDSAVDLVHFTILRPPGKQDGVPVTELSLIAFPTRELFLEKIDEFDLIIFDRYPLRGILPGTYLDNVARYVERGGAVLVAAGPAFAGVESLYRSPLARVLPGEPTLNVYETGFSPRISEIGQRHPVTEGLENFAPRSRSEDGTPGWGRWFRMIELDPLAGHTVMTGPEDKPLLMLDRVGRGRIALLASDQAWLWHRGFEGGGPQLELLRRLAHWMMQEPELEEEALTATARGRNVTIIRRSLTEGDRTVVVEAPDGSTSEIALREVSPGRYSGTFEGAENGLYRLSEGDLDTVIALGPAAPREFEDAISTASILEGFVTATRGAVMRLEQGIPAIRFVREGRVAAGRNWIGLVRREAFVATDIRLISLAPAWLLLLLGAGLMLWAWRREGR